MVQETTGEGVQPVSSTLLFANGSLTRFGPPTVTRFERQREDGTTQKVALYEKVPIFRSGTFSDSIGIEREWLSEQMHQMAANFEYLRRTGIFADVPVRVGHPSFIGGNPLKDVVGYFTALTCEDRVSPIEGDDETYTYLLADYEILDPSADKKISDGLYRNRSSEIGTFFTNAPVTELWPVMMGVAYVDIPAVQGLNGFAAQHQSDHFSIQMEEPMTGTAATGTTPASTSTPKPNLPGTSRAEFSIGGVTTTDTARVQAYIAQVESQNSEYASKISTLETQNAALAEFQANAMKAAREEKLEMLARSIDGKPAKLTAPQLDAEKAFCATLTDEQFTAYMKKWEDAPGNPILGQYGVQVTDDNRPAAQPNTEDAEKAEKIAAYRDTVAAFKLAASMTDERIKQTNAYKSLVALDPSYTL